MHKITSSLIIAFSLFTFSVQAKGYFPPETKKVQTINKTHDFKLTDQYQWLEDKKDPLVINWTKKQHDFTLNYFKNNYQDIKGLKAEIKNYIDRDIEGPLKLVGSRQFYSLKKKGDLQFKLYTKLNGNDILLFDPVKIDETGKSSISDIEYTNDGSKVAIGVQNKGAEIMTYYLLDTLTGKNISSPITDLRGFGWTKDGKKAYITVGTKEMLENQIPLQTFLHTIGSDRKNDQFLLAPKDAKNYAYLFDTKDSNFTFISEGDFYSNSLKVKEINSDKEAKLIYKSTKFEATPYANGNKLYFMTNYNAPNFKLMVADISNPEFENWIDLYSEKKTVLEGFEFTDKYLLIQDKKDLISRISAYDHDGNFLKKLILPEIGSVSFIDYQKDSDRLFVGLRTFTSPYRIYELNPHTLSDWKLFYESKTNVNTKGIEAKIEFVKSKDGKKVPIFVLHKKGLKLTGDNPTLLYGYGGFNIGIKPRYIGLLSSFINRGGVYINAGIRGGNEYGENWHRDGMLFNKQNTFDDFISVAEFLINQKYTNSKKLAVMGGSNGGLLIGAVITQRPDLFKAAISSVPLLDMIRFHKFLIARYWIPEYGDPDNKADFQNILQYSPYHNIRQGINHPTTMVIAGENDTRVDPLHAKKFVAALQNNVGQINPALLYMDFDSGHGSGKSTEQIIFDQYTKWKFIMNELEMN